VPGCRTCCGFGEVTGVSAVRLGFGFVVASSCARAAASSDAPANPSTRRSRRGFGFGFVSSRWTYARLAARLVFGGNWTGGLTTFAPNPTRGCPYRVGVPSRLLGLSGCTGVLANGATSGGKGFLCLQMDATSRGRSLTHHAAAYAQVAERDLRAHQLGACSPNRPH
jgi:hypothetical protein